MTTIDQIVEDSLAQAKRELVDGNMNLKSIIYQAVQRGMADAYDRGIQVGKGM